MWVILLPVLAVVVLLSVEFCCTRLVRPKPDSSGEPVLQAAAKKTKSATQDGRHEWAALIFRIVLSGILVALAGAVLLFGGKDHPWFQGANNVIFVVVGYWLPKPR